MCPAETLSKGPRPGNGVPAGSELLTKFRATAAYAAPASASSSKAAGATSHPATTHAATEEVFAFLKEKLAK